MVATLNVFPLVSLHARLHRLHRRQPELLLAVGLDDLLPLIDQLVEALPRHAMSLQVQNAPEAAQVAASGY